MVLSAPSYEWLDVLQVVAESHLAHHAEALSDGFPRLPESAGEVASLLVSQGREHLGRQKAGCSTVTTSSPSAV